MGLRQERMADEIRDILAVNFQGGRMNDPRLEFVTVTAVKISADMQLATIYFRLFNDGDPQRALKGLESASGYLRKQLKVLDIRRVPELRFLYDTTLESAQKIEGILHKLSEE
ncbi:MAG: 30S ribosome-binding factor RbfA [Proteobacteria bacterium]|nr:30S ribosome-binding factor RbfA [Pseudomonadota bacterium]